MAKRSAKSKDADKQIGQRIRKFRRLRKHTLHQLAGKIGVSYQQLQKYEKGDNRVAASRLLEISQALQISISDFYGIEESKKIPENSEILLILEFRTIKDHALKTTLRQLISLLSD